MLFIMTVLCAVDAALLNCCNQAGVYCGNLVSAKTSAGAGRCAVGAGGGGREEAEARGRRDLENPGTGGGVTL